MLKLATLIQNPGEPDITSQYKSPSVLRELGYNGLVLYNTTALSGVISIDDIEDREVSRWVGQLMDQAVRRADEAAAAGLGVYLFYDALVLPVDYVRRHEQELTCAGAQTTLCPASEAAVDRSMAALDALLRKMPRVDGVVLRFGDTDASRLPHLVGNDIYSPHCARCSQLGRADRVVNLIQRAYDVVVQRHSLRLIARAWNVRPSGFHDSIELAERIVSRLPGSADDDKLVLSFKCTETDFWRYQNWNQASLVCGGRAQGGRPILYELQCQREFEGKGGLPNFQPALWRDGMPEVDANRQGGLAAAATQVNLAGLLAWVRGGGWGGPFVSDESWIDANVYAIPKLAEDPSAEPSDLARQWAVDRLGVQDPSILDKLVDILTHSPEFVRQAFYMQSYAATKSSQWHPAADWISDDLLNAQAAWRMIQRVPTQELDTLIREKELAADQVGRDRHELQQLVGDRDHPRLEPLVNTLIYAESLTAAMRDLIAGLVAWRKFRDSKSRDDAEAARGRILAAQSNWNHHTQRHAMLPGTATPFRERGFWDLTQQVLDEVG
ncbi:MAG: hypothetical protein AAGH88_15300 [Planctomycetota bacterium]